MKKKPTPPPSSKNLPETKAEAIKWLDHQTGKDRDVKPWRGWAKPSERD